MEQLFMIVGFTAACSLFGSVLCVLEMCGLRA